MENHGVMTVGYNLYQAYDRMEVLEVAADPVGRSMGELKTFSNDHKTVIDSMHE